MPQSRIWWALALIIILGIFLRGYNLTGRSIWFDESFSWRLIQFPYQEMISRAAQDVHPPLYYIFLKTWAIVFGSSLLSLRSFSLFCSLGVIAGSYLFTFLVCRSRRAGYIAAILTAISGWVISYAVEARMYPLGMALALCSSIALLLAVRKKSYLWFVLYGCIAAAFLLTHYYSLFTIAAQIMYLLGILIVDTRGRIIEILQESSWWGLLLSLLIILLLFSPWAPAFFYQVSQVREAYWIPKVTWRSLPETFTQFFIPSTHIPSETISERFMLFIPISLVSLLWVALALFRSKKTLTDGIFLTILLGLIPFLSSLIVSFSGTSLYNDRFFAFAGIFIFIAIAVFIDQIHHTSMRRSIIALTIIGIALTTLRYWNEIDLQNKGGLRAGMQEVFQNNPHHILVSSPYIYFASKYYAQEEFNRSDITHLYSSTGALSHFSGAPIAVRDDIAVPEDIAKYRGTVGVIDTTGFTEKPFIAPATWKETTTKTFPELFVYQGNIIVRMFTVCSTPDLEFEDQCTAMSAALLE